MPGLAVQTSGAVINFSQEGIESIANSFRAIISAGREEAQLAAHFMGSENTTYLWFRQALGFLENETGVVLEAAKKMAARDGNFTQAAAYMKDYLGRLQPRLDLLREAIVEVKGIHQYAINPNSPIVLAKPGSFLEAYRAFRGTIGSVKDMDETTRSLYMATKKTAEAASTLRGGVSSASRVTSSLATPAKAVDVGNAGRATTAGRLAQNTAVTAKVASASSSVGTVLKVGGAATAVAAAAYTGYETYELGQREEVSTAETFLAGVETAGNLAAAGGTVAGATGVGLVVGVGGGVVSVGAKIAREGMKEDRVADRLYQILTMSNQALALNGIKKFINSLTTGQKKFEPEIDVTN